MGLSTAMSDQIIENLKGRDEVPGWRQEPEELAVF
jgi:hypothetical protein